MSDPIPIHVRDDHFPLPGSDLSDWRWFIAHLLGVHSPHFKYLDRLCREHGVGYVIEMDSDLFLDHIARVAFTNDHEGAV